MNVASTLTPAEAELVRLKRRSDRVRASADAAKDDLDSAVLEYLEQGGSATRLGHLLGVSRGRIYQLRDRAAERVKERGRAKKR